MDLLPQCEATVTTPDRANTGNRCRRSAVTGSTKCVMHGGAEDTTTPEAMEQRRDRWRQKCTSLKRDGTPCSKYAIAGGFVCQNHGGQLPSVRKAATDRMMQLVAPAVAELQGIITRPGTSDSDRLRAIAMVLDRTGFGPKAELGVEVKKYEQVMEGIIRAAPVDAAGVYLVSEPDRGDALELPQAPSGADWDDYEQEDGSIPQPVVLNAYRARRGPVPPPPSERR